MKALPNIGGKHRVCHWKDLIFKNDQKLKTTDDHCTKAFSHLPTSFFLSFSLSLVATMPHCLHSSPNSVTIPSSSPYLSLQCNCFIFLFPAVSLLCVFSHLISPIICPVDLMNWSSASIPTSSKRALLLKLERKDFKIQIPCNKNSEYILHPPSLIGSSEIFRKQTWSKA